MAKNASNIIGFHFCSDAKEISESRYQPTRYTSPAIYAIGDFYFAAPTNNLPPKNFKIEGKEWEFVAEYYNRKIFKISAI